MATHTGLKTWSVLAKARRNPSEYEIVSTNGIYRNRYPDRAYELSPAPGLAMNSFYQKHVSNSPLQHPDWDSFRDPDQLIYRMYTRIQDGQEEYVDGLLDEYNGLGTDADLAPEWLDIIERRHTPLRYLLTTAQMGSAYLVQMAPSSTISICAAFQEADCFRWMQRTAYRTNELRKSHPDRGFGTGERAIWEDEPAWQGFRELMEKLLCAYDWGEHVIALNLVAKPAIEEACLRQFGILARSYNDHLLALLADAQLRDCDRHRRWSRAFVELCYQQDGNKAAIQGWVNKWLPLADQAIDAFWAGLPEGAATAARAKSDAAAFRKTLDLAG